MKISAWHKQQGDEVEWYDPLFGGEYDKVYVSKIFGFTPDYQYPINAKEVSYGGSGYCIQVKDGKEYYDLSKNQNLPYEIEHIYPDYSIYPDLTQDTAYGFLTRGCPRHCLFCHTSVKDGCVSTKVADLSEFWSGQKKIVLLDQNILACKQWKDLLQQLIDSKASIEFNGGLDIRLMTEEKAKMIKQLRTHIIHFAWDRYEDGAIIKKNLQMFKEICDIGHRCVVYVLCNYDTNYEQDEERVQFIRTLNFNPYVMLYNKDSIPRNHHYKHFSRWVNNKFVFWKCKTYQEYKEQMGYE